MRIGAWRTAGVHCPAGLSWALRRHVEALDKLTAEEAVELGTILRAASIALKRIVGCDKTYVILFAEHPRYPHVHLHVVPRMHWFTDDDRSTAVFRFLNVPEEEQVAVDERERLARAIGASMAEVIEGHR
jgi:diadenosine tetraphosphate (Ap4A) HIT family hydrolase